MKALVFGATGQVAQELRVRLPKAVFLSRSDADLRAPDRCAEAIAACDAEVVINAAAYTAVDQAETDEDLAMLVNGLAPAAMARAATINDRGYYFDFIEFKANGEKSMTPSTPCISLIYGLRHQLNKIFAEGVENRYARHAKLNGMVHEWVRRNGFEFFAPEGYRSMSLTCVANNKGIDVAAFIGLLKKNHSMIIDGGYGKLKGKTFRVSNMGDESEASIGTVIAALDDSLAKL